MPSRLAWFGVGVVTTIALLAGGGYLFVKACGIAMDTTAPPLPLEEKVARIALRVSGL